MISSFVQPGHVNLAVPWTLVTAVLQELHCSVLVVVMVQAERGVLKKLAEW
jgi:hypothetical protein